MSTTHNGKRIIAGALLFGGVELAGLVLSMGTAQAFDPQPEPPARWHPRTSCLQARSAGSTRNLTPPASVPSSRLNPGVIRGFNRPEPPVLPGPAS